MRRTRRYRRYRELITWRHRRRRPLVTERSPWPNWKIDLLVWVCVAGWIGLCGFAVWRGWLD